eukprot:3519261-Amphidinium_carterae.1
MTSKYMTSIGTVNEANGRGVKRKAADLGSSSGEEDRLPGLPQSSMRVLQEAVVQPCIVQKCIAASSSSAVSSASSASFEQDVQRCALNFGNLIAQSVAWGLTDLAPEDRLEQDFGFIRPSAGGEVPTCAQTL